MLLRDECVHIERTAADAVAGSNSLYIQMRDGGSKLNWRSPVANHRKKYKSKHFSFSCSFFQTSWPGLCLGHLQHMDR